MTGINFPLTISEMSKMREDGDLISLYFSRACLVCFLFIFIMGLIYYLSSHIVFKDLAFVSVTLTVICFFVVYIYRPIFLSDDTKKQKALDRLRRKKYKALTKFEGLDYEEALEKLTPDERQGYASYLDKLLDKHIK